MLHLITSTNKYKLRIDLEDVEGNRRYAEYSTFNIGSRGTNYQLSVGGYTGDAGELQQNNNNYIIMFI